MRLSTSLLAAGALLGLATACATSNGAINETAMNTLTVAQQADGWKLLFDGRTTAGWRNYRKDWVSPGWSVAEGILTRSGDDAGDIITIGKYRNFDLMLDWRVAEGGNSGLFYRGTEDHDFVWQTAPEMQILDDERHADGKSLLTSAGSVFALYEAPRGAVKPAGQWNTARVLANGNHVEHWLNGTKLLEYERGSADWNERVAKSKFRTMPAFGRPAEGHIGLQDHGDLVEFRNIRIKVLP